MVPAAVAVSRDAGSAPPPSFAPAAGGRRRGKEEGAEREEPGAGGAARRELHGAGRAPGGMGLPGRRRPRVSRAPPAPRAPFGGGIWAGTLLAEERG